MRLCLYLQDCILIWIYGMQINYITLHYITLLISINIQFLMRNLGSQNVSISIDVAYHLHILKRSACSLTIHRQNTQLLLMVKECCCAHRRVCCIHISVNKHNGTSQLKIIFHIISYIQLQPFHLYLQPLYPYCLYSLTSLLHLILSYHNFNTFNTNNLKRIIFCFFSHITFILFIHFISI